MVSTEEILITMLGKDQVTPVVNNIEGNMNSAFSNMTSNAQSSANSIGQAYQSVFDSIGTGLSALNQGMMGISSANSMVLNQLGATKSAMDYVYGTTAKADTNKVLVRSWGDAKTTWEDIYDTIDHVTDNSLTSMQDLIPAMNAFKASTNATGTQLKDSVAEDMAQFGAYVLALTGSEQLARTAMTDLSKGLVGKGSFNALDQYGVTRASLEANGWSGENEDIEGYMSAIRKVSGQAEELMDTSEGLDAQLGKMWSRAGKKIGNEMLPGMKSLKIAFMELDDELDNNLSTTILRVSLGIEEAQQKLYIFNTLWQGVKNISEAFNTLKVVLGFTKVEQEANNLMQEENNRLIQESNLALAENNDLRLANAEAMGLQNLGMQDYNPYGDAMGYGTGMATGEESGSWGSDVLANTAGGVLESRYQKMKGGDVSNVGTASKQNAKVIREGTKNLQDEIKAYENYIDVLGDLDDSHKNLDKASAKILTTPQTGMYGTSAFNQFNVGSSFIDEVYKEMGKYNLGTSQKTFDKVGETYVNPQPWNKMKGATGVKTLQELSDANKDERARAGALLNELKNSPIDETYEEATEVIMKEGTGPFNRLSIFLNEKKKRKLPSINTDFGLRQTASSLKTYIGGGITNLKESFNSIKTGFNQFRDLTLADKLDDVWDRLKTGLGGLRGGSEVMEEVAVEMGETATATGVVATGSEAVAVESEVASAGMVEAETGLTFMGLAEMGLVGAFTTLLVPTLAIAGVIAILIPIIAGLVMEALFFIQLVGQFMSSLDFNFNIDGVAEKFQELGTALAWLGVAMASMSFAGLLTGIAYIFTGFGNVNKVLGKAVSMLSETVTVLNAFQYSAQVDPNVATTLSNLGTALNGVTMALGSLVGVQLMANIGNIVTGFGHLGSLTDTFRQAKDDLQEAIDSINQMDFTGIDETKVNTIKTTLEAIGAFCDAFSGLNSIRTDSAIGDFTSWLLNGGILGGQGATIEQAFASAKEDIERASRALAQFDGSKIETPSPETVEKLKSVSEAITTVADSINNLRQLRDGYNWDGWVEGIFGGEDIETIFGRIKTDLETVSNVLKDMNISDIPEGLAENLNRVNEGISGVANAVNSLQTMPDVKQTDIGPKVREAVGSVQLAINGLGTIKGENINEGLGTMLTNVNTGVQGVASVVNSALAIPMVDQATIQTRIQNAVSSVSTIIDELNGLKGKTVVDASGLIQQVNSALEQVRSALNGSDFGPQGRHIGSSLKNGVASGMMGLYRVVSTQLQNGVNHSGAYSKGRHMGTSLTNGFKAGLNLGQAISSEIASIDVGSLFSGLLADVQSNVSSIGDTEPSGALGFNADSVLKYMDWNDTTNALADVSRMQSLNNMNKSSNLGTNKNNVTIHISEGAVQLDARNMTKKESRQIMINALEGLSAVKNVDVNGA